MSPKRHRSKHENTFLLSASGQRAAGGRSVLFSSNLFSHKVTNVLTGSERDPLILLSPPLQPHGEWSSTGWGSPEFFSFSGRNFSEVRSRASEVHTRALSNGQKHKKHGDTHLITSCRRSWSPCRRSVSWSSRCHRRPRGRTRGGTGERSLC